MQLRWILIGSQIVLFRSAVIGSVIALVLFLQHSTENYYKGHFMTKIVFDPRNQQ